MNILMILTDQLRADAIGTYGCACVNTKNLDELARDGVLFENCYANNPICTPSRASIWTGKSLMGHGVYKLHDILPDSERLFSDRLKEKGYTTALFGKLHVSARSKELEERHPHDGFDIYEQSIDAFSPEGKYSEYKKWLGRNYPECLERLRKENRKFGAFPKEAHFTRWVSQRTMEFITKQPNDKPFFCCMSIVDPHDPYNDVPVEVLKSFNENKMPEPLGYDGENRPDDVNREHENCYLGNFNKYTIEQIRQIRKGYYASINFIDEEVGRVIELLKKQNRYEDTMILFTSDHGDMIGDRGLLVKGGFFYDQCTKVPLIIKYPQSDYKNQRIDSLVQPNDIAATVLTCAGFEREALKEAMPCSRDLALLLDDQKKHERDIAVCMYRNTGVCKEKLYWSPRIDGTMIRNKRYKLNVYHNVYKEPDKIQGELFDMINDPKEENNLWDNTEYSDVKFKLYARLMDWIVEKDVLYNSAPQGELFPPKSQWSENTPF